MEDSMQVYPKSKSNGKVQNVRVIPGNRITEGVEVSHVSQVSRLFLPKRGYQGAVGRLMNYFGSYITFQTEGECLAVSAWTLAAWFARCNWLKLFPHLALNSPLPGSAKTSLLNLILWAGPNEPGAAREVLVDPTKASVERFIDSYWMYDTSGKLVVQDNRRLPIVAIDEHEKGDESPSFRALLNACIDRTHHKKKCGSREGGYQPESQALFCPKCFAKLGAYDPTFADRCLQIELLKRPPSVLKRFKDMEVDDPEAEADEIRVDLEYWSGEMEGAVEDAYKSVKLFPLHNERMAKLLRPLQAVLVADENAGLMDVLESYATDLCGQETEILAFRVLRATRDVFAQNVYKKDHIPSAELARMLSELLDENIDQNGLAKLLRQTFKIRPYQLSKGRGNHPRGYSKAQFQTFWDRYVAPA
jgi:hypothetical protein